MSSSESGELYLEVNDGNILNNLGHIFMHIFNQAEFTTYFSSDESWYNTGYSYTAGTELFLYPFGAHADNPNNDNWIETPAGRPYLPTSGHPLNGAPENGLIGKIGENGIPFYIGAGGNKVLSDSESGELYLEVNDGDISNNLGYIFMHVFSYEPTTIKNYEKSNLITIFPNPTRENICVMYPNGIHENLIIELSDVSGKQILTSELTNNHTTLNIGHLTTGVYFLSVRDITGNLLKTEKVFKK